MGRGRRRQSSVGFGIGRKKARALVENQSGVVLGWLRVVSFFLFVDRQIGMCADKKKDSGQRGERSAQIGQRGRRKLGINFTFVGGSPLAVS